MSPSIARAPSSTVLRGACAIPAAGQELLLLPERAIFLPSTRSLLLADLHLGKGASFRALGVPVPSGTTERTLTRVDELLARTGARTLYLLGDLLHGPELRRGNFFEELARWRARHRKVEMVLVRGNHDSRAGDPPAACGIEVVEPGYRLGLLRLLHEPEDEAWECEPGCAPQAEIEPGADANSCAFSLAGHLHPVWRLAGRVDTLRLPCFWLRRGNAVLPAFGEFTGGWPVQASPDDRVFVSDGETVHEAPIPGRQRRVGLR